MAWAPSPEGLQQLLGLFKASSSADNATHRAIQQQLTSFNAIPDYNNYLAYIFNQMRVEAGSVRQMAGLVLKNNVKEHWGNVHPDVQRCGPQSAWGRAGSHGARHAARPSSCSLRYVRENLLGSIGDAEPYIRTTVRAEARIAQSKPNTGAPTSPRRASPAERHVRSAGRIGDHDHNFDVRPRDVA